MSLLFTLLILLQERILASAFCLIFIQLHDIFFILIVIFWLLILRLIVFTFLVLFIILTLIVLFVPLSFHFLMILFNDGLIFFVFLAFKSELIVKSTYFFCRNLIIFRFFLILILKFLIIS